MSTRTALLICCSAEEAKTIREQAKMERRPVSNYVLNIVMRVVDFGAARTVGGQYKIASRVITAHTPLQHPRTAVLMRCSIDEAAGIRDAAERKGTTISGYVLQCLHRSWDVRRITQGFLGTSVN